MAGAGLLHQDRLAADPHLYRPPRPQGAGQGAARQDISKQQQTSDWGAPELSDAQKEYAASDVRYLHQLKEKLDERLAREGRTELAQACFDFLPHRALLDLAGWAEVDIFAHV
jgi:ribonuclease D